MIASSKLFLNEYSVFKIITQGIRDKIIHDNVAELYS